MPVRNDDFLCAHDDVLRARADDHLLCTHDDVLRRGTDGNVLHADDDLLCPRGAGILYVLSAMAMVVVE
jgi:hypothetical protein